MKSLDLIESGECQVNMDDGGSGSFKPRTVQMNNFFGLKDEQDFERHIIEMRDKIRRGELLQCQIE